MEMKTAKKYFFLVTLLTQAFLLSVSAGCGTDVGDNAGNDSSVSLDAALDLDSGSPFGCPDDSSGWTVGAVIRESAAFDGYTLFAPLSSLTTYLVDMCGRLVHSWEGLGLPGNSVYLLENGNLLRTESLEGSTFQAGGQGGRVLEIAWDGTIIWSYEYSSATHLQHHDIERLPNGNVLVLAWERKSAAQAIAAGRNPALITEGELWPDHIVEVRPDGASGGTIVWEWHVWDHLVQDFDPTKDNYGVVEDHPELIDINFSRGGGADWNHTNSIDYNPQYDQIVLSVRHFSEIWVIDHSTSTIEAADHTGGNSGRGGDIIYRWGNPQAYRAGSVADHQLFFQHDAQWIEPGLPGEGNILVFNNGSAMRPGGEHSSVDEIAPPVDADGHYALTVGSAFAPAAPVWSYTAPTPADFFADHISGAQRLASGNTLICSGPDGAFFEVTSQDEVVWMYINPVIDQGVVTQGDPIPVGPQGTTNAVFRAYRYPPDYQGLAGKDLTPGDYIEMSAGQ